MSRPIAEAESKTRDPFILQKPGSFVSGFDYTLSPYSGCALGCTYCYVPTVQHGLPQKLGGWGTFVNKRSRIAEYIRRYHAAGKLTGARIFMSATTDPYQPIEAQAQLTRAALEELAESDFEWLLISTRSPLVLNDLDILRDPRLIDRVEVGISISSDDEELHNRWEPFTCSYARRFEVADTLRHQGLAVRIHAAPLARHSAAFFPRCLQVANWVWADGVNYKKHTGQFEGMLTLYQAVSALKTALTMEGARAERAEAARVRYGRDTFASRWSLRERRLLPPKPRGATRTVPATAEEVTRWT